jgi:murein DD-endopeptidase MepM/ murein hydrolase activator NlpD
MALPKLALVEQQPGKRDNVIYADFRNSLGVVGQAMPNAEAPAGGDKEGLKKLSENLTKLHDVVYQTIASLKSKQLLDEYIYEDQLRVQAENVREGQGKFVQQIDNPGDLLGAGSEQDTLLAAFASLSNALEMFEDRIGAMKETCDCAPGMLGGGMLGDDDDELDLDLDLSKKRKPRSSRSFRGGRFIANKEALDGKGQLKPGYEVVDTGKSGLRYRKIPGWRSQASRVVGKLVSSGGRVLSKPMLATGLGVAGMAGMAATMGGPGMVSRGLSTAGNFLRNSLTTGLPFLGPVGLGVSAAFGAVSNFFGGSSSSSPMFRGNGGDFGGAGASGNWNPVPIGPAPPLTLGTGGFALPAAGALGSGFGMRRHPILGDMRKHEGVDIPGTAGEAIVASRRGRITFAGRMGTYGELVKIDHGEGLETRYAHLSSIKVRENQQVAQGEVIGGMGRTGRSTGVHLHFEVRMNGRAVDPRPYLTATPKPPAPRPREKVTPPVPKAKKITVTAPSQSAAAPTAVRLAASGGATGVPRNHQGAYLVHFA